MTLPTYRRTSGPFVTLYRHTGGAEVEIGCWFGASAHAQADECQQEDVLAHCGTASAMQSDEMKTTANNMKTTTTNNTQHTPGPWTVEPDIMFGKKVLGPFIDGSWPIMHQGDGPDAYLIAAAPDLLTLARLVVGGASVKLLRECAEKLIARIEQA